MLIGSPARAIAVIAAPALATVVAVGMVGACRRVADERPIASLATSPETEARFGAIRARWADASSKHRAAMRPELEALLIDVERRSDGLEPIVRAYLAMAWLDAGVPAAAEAVARPLVDGRPGVPNDLATLVKGSAARRLGRARESIDLLRPLVGKLIDPFARPMLYEEITAAHLDDQRWEDALVYAEGWLRSASPAEKPAVRSAVERVLRRIPEDVVVRLLDAEANAPVEARHSADLVLALSARLGESAPGGLAGTTADAGVEGSLEPPTSGAGAPTGAGAVVGSVAPTLASPPRFDPKTIALLVPTSAPGWAVAASAIVRAAAAVTAPSLATALHADAGADASLSVAPVGYRLVVFDTGGTASGVAAALDAAERDGAGVVVGGATDAEATALLANARKRRVPSILLRRAGSPPDGGEKPTWISIGPSQDDEELATLAIAKAVTSAAVGADVAVVEPWPDPGTAPEPPTDPMRWRCDAAPKVAGGTAFPIAAWKARKVSAVVVLGDARCARRIADELVQSPGAFRPTFVLGPAALDLAHAPIPFARTVLVAGSLPADDQAPADLRTLWIDQGAPVSWWNGLGHDAVVLAGSALQGAPKATSDPAALQQARATTAARLLAANAVLWTTTAKGPAANGIVPRATSMRAFAPGIAAKPAWAP